MGLYRRTTEQWVEVIADQELPAITSIARLLDGFANDDVSSIPKLSKAVLHDQSLSSCLLKVANSIQHMSHNKVTTVSRACVVLGIQSVKNICLTSKLIEGMLNNEALSPDIYEKLTRQMASAFFSGLLARMMVPSYNEDTQEEVYLAAMLYRIGETAFWCSGKEACEAVIEYSDLSQLEFEQKCSDIIGTKFSDITKGLAKQWSLGTLLEKSLDSPESRTIEMKIIYLSDKLSHFIDAPPETALEFNSVLDEICELKGITQNQLKAAIEQTREKAKELLSSYGAAYLGELLKPIPTIDDFQPRMTSAQAERQTKERAQLESLMALTQLSKTSKDFNEYIELILKSMSQIFGFQRSVFLMQTQDKKHVKARISINEDGHDENYKTQLALTETENILAYIIQKGEPVLINDYREVKWRNYISLEVEKLINEGVICLAPVKINHNVIGVIAGQNFNKRDKIRSEEFTQFCFLVEHLNMCLSMITR